VVLGFVFGSDLPEQGGGRNYALAVDFELRSLRFVCALVMWDDTKWGG